MRCNRPLLSSILATSLVFVFSASSAQEVPEGLEIPENRGLPEPREILSPLPLFVDGVPVEEFVADEEQVRAAVEQMEGLAGLSDEALIEMLQAIEAREVTVDDVPPALRGISGLPTQFVLRAWLFGEHYLFAGKIRDWLYIDEDKDGKAGSGHLAVDMKYWRYDSVADFQAGAPPNQIILLHWHIQVNDAYNVHPRQNDYNAPFPDVDLVVPQEAIDSIWHPARDLRWKLHARGQGIIIREVFRKVDDNPIELLPPTHPVYGLTDEACVDVLFHPYPPEIELPPQLGYCLGRCEEPHIVNTGA